jgi:hypothetical protein
VGEDISSGCPKIGVINGSEEGGVLESSSSEETGRDWTSGLLIVCWVALALIVSIIMGNDWGEG